MLLLETGMIAENPSVTGITWGVTGLESDMQQSKTCTTCKQTKAAAEFYVRNKERGWLYSSCIECSKAYNKDYRTSNRDKEIARHRTWYYNNQEYALDQKYEIYWSDPELARKLALIQRDKNPDAVKATQDKHRAKFSEYYKDLEKIQKHKRRSLTSFVISIKEINKLRKSPCFECGSFQQIHIDHIVPIKLGGTNSIGNLMPLCQKCNLSKGSKTYKEWQIWKRKNQC
jgi:hypothetical protein